MKQTGLLFEIRPTDYILGSTSPLKGLELNPSGDWIPYRPSDEKQYDFKFDTMSCSTFSATNDLEALFNFLWEKGEFSESQRKWLIDNGYVKNWKFNFSDRFSAISNGTMPQGQYIQNVWDDFRHTGLIPESDLPFGGSNQAEYLDKSKITQAMRDKAAKFLELIIEKDSNGKPMINYEWVPVITGIELNDALKQAPLQIVVTKESPTHAIALLRMDTEFETYPPFLRKRNRTVAYSLKPIVRIKKEQAVQKYKHFNPKTDPKMVGLRHELMLKLDAIREDAKFAMIITSGLRTKEENDALQDSASNSGHLRGWEADIYCVDSSRRDKLIELSYKHGITRRGIGKDFVHLGLDPSLPQGVMWHYYK